MCLALFIIAVKIIKFDVSVISAGRGFAGPYRGPPSSSLARNGFLDFLVGLSLSAFAPDEVSIPLFCPHNPSRSDITEFREPACLRVEPVALSSARLLERRAHNLLQAIVSLVHLNGPSDASVLVPPA